MTRPKLPAQFFLVLIAGLIAVLVFLQFGGNRKASEIDRSPSTDVSHATQPEGQTLESENRKRAATLEISEQSGNKKTAKPVIAGNSSQPSNRKETRKQAARQKTAVLPHLGPVKVLDSRIVKDASGNPIQTLLIEAPEGSKYPILRAVRRSETAAPVIMVADHVLAQFDAGIGEVELRRTLASKGLSIRKKMVNPGLYVIASSAEVTLDTVPDSLELLQNLGAIAVEASEPDFLVFSQDDDPSKPFRNITTDSGGPEVGWNPGSASYGGTTNKETNAKLQEARVASAKGDIKPAFTANRMITFDPPFFLGGADNYAPYAYDQNMRITPNFNGVSVKSGGSLWPSNGSLYANFSTGSGGTEVFHSEGLPFTLHSMDLAEYSTVFDNPSQLVFTAEREDGSTFTHTVTIDGLIDGDGPIDDWQNFVFGNLFDNIVSLNISGSASFYSIDNIDLTVHGAETPRRPKPAYPLIYDIDFSEPEHRLDETMEVGGHFAPKTIRMGNPIVRSAVGPLTDQPVELKLGDGGFNTSTNYEQVLMGIGLAAAAYRFEMDFVVDSLGPDIFSDSFTVLFDNGVGVQRIDFEEDNDVSIFQSGIHSTGLDIDHYVLGQKHHLRVDMDMVAGTWLIFLDEVQIHSGPFGNSDLSDIRVHFSDSSGGSALAAVDNIKISAFDPGGITDPFEPDLNLSPLSINFGDVREGSFATRTVRLNNAGQEELDITALSVNRTQLSILNDTAPFSIQPGGFMDIQVRFSPTSIGTLSGALTVTSNDPAAPSQSVPLTGNGTSQQSFSVSDENITVAVDPDQTTFFNLTLNNSGASPINWTATSTGGSASETTPPSPDDPSLGLLWGIRDPSQSGAGIAAETAWAVTTGSDRIVVGVIDTGVEWGHPDLAANIWVNEDEIAGNGIDDDNNGFIDDVRGWDFYDDDANPEDTESGHGTHVAGTIAAVGNNGTGVTGVAWTARIMPIRFLGPWGGTTSDAINSIDYATLNGARITNNSWGGGSSSVFLQSAIARALNQDRLFVAAAGNSGLNADTSPMYPAAYPLSNIISVAATDRDDQLAYFSNYGATSVDLGAPGVSIYSTFLRNSYRSLSGTSMAAPHVAGAAVLLLAQDAGRSFYQTKQLLMDHVDAIPAMNGRALSNGRLNILNSLGGIPESNWLSLSSSSGSLGGGASGAIQLNFDSAGLASGRYTEILTLTSNDPIRPIITIPVSFEVSGVAATSFPGPTITSHPLDREVAPGGNTSLNVSATANVGILSYEWFVGEIGNKANPIGPNNATLNLVNVMQENSYWVFVTDGQGGSFSNSAVVSLGDPVAAPDPPQNITATDGVSTGPVMLSWTAGARATSYRIHRHTSNDSGATNVLAEVNVTNYSDATAVPLQTYYYWVSAVNSQGTSTLAGSDTGYRNLAAPGSFSASDGTSANSVALSWQASPGATGYRVYRHLTNSFENSNLIADLAGLNFDDTTGNAGTVYFYWVEAYTGGGNSNFAGPDTGFRTLHSPSNISASDGSSTGFVTVTWESAEGASGYRIYRSLSNSPGSSELIGDVAGLSFNDVTATPGVAQYYWVLTYSGSGASPLAGGDSGYRALSLPGNVSASNGTPISYVAVAWDASPGATSYQVFRNTSNTLSGAQQLSTLAGLNYNDGGTVAGTTYYYWVRAKTALTITAYSGPATGIRFGGRTWDEYKQANNLNAYTDDPDGDGESALAEWALGGSNPKSASSRPPYIVRIRNFSGTDYLTLSFLRMQGGAENSNTYIVQGHIYTCQGSTGMEVWDQTPVAVSPPGGLSAPPEGYEWASFRFPFGIDGAKGFLKVDVAPEE